MTVRSLVALFLLCILSPFSLADPGLTPVNPLPATVKDPFFSLLIGIIQAGTEVDADSAQLRGLLTEFACSFDIPFNQVARMAQYADRQTRERLIRLDFLKPMDIPIPYSILFYHPGRISTDSSILFRVSGGTYADSDWLSEPSEVFILELVRGGIVIDLDDWLELFFGAHLEDARIGNVVFFTWDGRWMGMLQGTGLRTGRVFRSFFDFTGNAVVFPLPAALDRAGKSIVPDWKAGGSNP